MGSVPVPSIDYKDNQGLNMIYIKVILLSFKIIKRIILDLYVVHSL